MALWSVKPQLKKSIIDRQKFTKDDNPPVLEEGVDIFNCDYPSEMIETSDACWEDHDTDDCDEETCEWLEEFFDEGNSFLDLLDNGWICSDGEMIIDCEMEIEMIEPTSTIETKTEPQSP
jgi:hypothetical protein